MGVVRAVVLLLGCGRAIASWVSSSVWPAQGRDVTEVIRRLVDAVDLDLRIRCIN